jgi:hypothetical protein
MSCTIHNVPGRLRIKIPSIKQQPLRARKIEALFNRRKGVKMVVANDLTGSLKIQYDPDLVDSEQLLHILAEKNVVDESVWYQNEGDSYALATRITQACGKAVINWALSKTLQSNGLGLLAALI